jgi:hypothetical protein
MLNSVVQYRLTNPKTKNRFVENRKYRNQNRVFLTFYRKTKPKTGLSKTGETENRVF